MVDWVSFLFFNYLLWYNIDIVVNKYLRVELSYFIVNLEKFINMFLVLLVRIYVNDLFRLFRDFGVFKWVGVLKC